MCFREDSAVPVQYEAGVCRYSRPGPFGEECLCSLPDMNHDPSVVQSNHCTGYVDPVSENVKAPVTRTVHKAKYLSFAWIFVDFVNNVTVNSS